MLVQIPNTNWFLLIRKNYPISMILAREAFSKIHLANPAKFVNPYIIGVFENRLVEKH